MDSLKDADIFYKIRYDGRFFISIYDMKCSYECLEDVVRTVKRLSSNIGTIVVVQINGRSSHCNPHLHIIMTNGEIHTGC